MNRFPVLAVPVLEEDNELLLCADELELVATLLLEELVLEEDCKLDDEECVLDELELLRDEPAQTNVVMKSERLFPKFVSGTFPHTNE